jgi:hypothetical protein
LVSDYQSRKENDLQIIVPRTEFIQSQESGGMVMASMWNKGTELGMKKFTEPIKRLQLMQQLITSLASQLICLNISSEVWLMVEQLLNMAILAFLKSQLLKIPDKLKMQMPPN